MIGIGFGLDSLAINIAHDNQAFLNKGKEKLAGKHLHKMSSFFSTSSSAADSKVAAAATAAATTLESTTTTGATTNQKSPHYHFIHSMILPSTVKIQKELKGRKFKVRYVLWCVCVFMMCFVFCCVFGSCCVVPINQQHNLTTT